MALTWAGVALLGASTPSGSRVAPQCARGKAWELGKGSVVCIRSFSGMYFEPEDPRWCLSGPTVFMVSKMSSSIWYWDRGQRKASRMGEPALLWGAGHPHVQPSLKALQSGTELLAREAARERAPWPGHRVPVTAQRS